MSTPGNTAPGSLQLWRGNSPNKRLEAVGLRVGLVLDSYVAPRWLAALVQKIILAPYLETCLIILKETGDVPQQPLRLKLTDLLYRLYRWTDRKLMRSGEDVLASFNLRPILGRIRAVMVQDLENLASEVVKNKLPGPDLDIII